MLIRRIVTAVVLLFAAIVCHPQQAKSDWYATVSPLTPPFNTDYGADYFGAACYAVQLVYVVPCQPIGFDVYLNSSNVPALFYLAGGSYTDPPYSTSWTGYAVAQCPSGSLAVLGGCATEVDNQGARAQGCPSGTPDANGAARICDPIDIATGNVFEEAADFRTIGQNPLISLRFYNSDLNYAAAVTGAFPRFQSSINFFTSRFGYGWRSDAITEENLQSATFWQNRYIDEDHTQTVPRGVAPPLFGGVK